MKQRGNIYVILALVIVACLSLLALFKFIDAHWETSAGVSKGKSIVQKEWNDANKLARDQNEADRKKREAEAARASHELADANAKASDYETKWRKTRATNRNPLASVTCPANPASSGGAQPVLADSSVDGGVGVRLRLSDDFLRDYDAAWTGQRGEPVFADTGRPPDPAAPAVGLDALIDTHGENAGRCSANARQMNKLIDLIIKLRGGK